MTLSFIAGDSATNGYGGVVPFLLNCQACGVEYRLPAHRVAAARFCSRLCHNRNNKLKSFVPHPASLLAPREFRVARPASERFWAKVAKSDNCWEWTAKRKENGYGDFAPGTRSSDRHVYAHRYSYELHYGPIPDGHQVCHRCDNPPCVRPDHLFLGTHRDNMDDMIAKGRQAHALLTPKQAADVRIEHARGPRGIGSALARRYGVSKHVISRIATGKTY